jgi:hypothetical protein
MQRYLCFFGLISHLPFLHRTITMADHNLEKLKSKMTTLLGSFSANEQSTFARL